MNYVKEHIFETLEVKQSKFIAHLLPYTHYEEVLASLKKEHTKARHFVVAWRYINEFDQVVEHCSDDGEPKGTSGKPTLAVLSGNTLINTAVIIVRYFGGTKLGKGGLVRAYSDACNKVIHLSKVFPYIKLQAYCFSAEYSDISLIEYALQKGEISIKHKDFNEKGAVFSVLSDKGVWADFARKNERLIKTRPVLS